MSTIELDEKLRQGRRRWLGSKTLSAGLQRDYAESVASRAPGAKKVVNSISVTK